MTNYLIYNPKKGKPKTTHHDYSEALREAERIAKKELETVYVLRIESIITPEITIHTEYYPPELDNLT